MSFKGCPYAYSIAVASLGDSILVPCGKCWYCRKRNAQDWVTRMHFEKKKWYYSYFLTLTYDDANLSSPVVCKRDVQLFLKRLRRQLKYHYNYEALKYFVIGEYGARSLRPHFHLIMHSNFCLHETYHKRLLSPIISRNWTKGFIQLGSANDGSFGYVASYVNKNCPGQLERYPGEKRGFDYLQWQKDDKEALECEKKAKKLFPVYRSVSIGYGIPQEETRRFFKRNLQSYVQLSGQEYKRRLPKYVKDKIFTEEEKLAIRTRYVEEHRQRIEEMFLFYQSLSYLQRRALARRQYNELKPHEMFTKKYKL